MNNRTHSVIIIEDEFFLAEDLKQVITDLGFWVKGVYHSGEAFLKETDWNFDMAVVDIFLSEDLSGLDVAEHLNKRNRPFIFLTANQDTQTLKLAAHLMPRAYLSKPFRVNDVSAALTMVANSQTPQLEFRGSSGKEKVNPNDICFIKADGAYIEVHLIEGKMVLRKLLKDILTELPDNFIQVHRSYAVNASHIDSRTASMIKIGNQEIPISRSYRDQLV